MRPAGMILLIMLIAGPLAGCGGPPTHFYTLTPMSPSAGADPVSCTGRPIAVNRVLLPESLDRQSIVLMDGSDRVDISDQNRWVAPLDGMIRQVLAEDLRLRLPAGRVVLPGDPPPPNGVAGIDVNLLQFAGDSAGKVTLGVDWTLLDHQEKAAVARSETISVIADSRASGSLVSNMSAAVGDLADRIVAGLPNCGS